MEKHRIGLLDGFRFVAVVFVVLYHYVAMGKSVTGLTHVFSYGYLGVEFFFIISGFVISYSLENTADISTFFTHRFKRLFPAMLLYSLLTFTITSWLDTDHLFKNGHYARNLLPGFTFINPVIWSDITSISFHWINGSYWSLWTEVQFYVVSACIYFLNRKRFFTNMLLTGIVIALMKNISVYMVNSHGGMLTKYGLMGFFKGWQYGDELFNLTFYIAWFMCGVIFYQLYKGTAFKNHFFRIGGSICVLLILYHDIDTYFHNILWPMLIGSLVMIMLFLTMIYKKQYLQFLDNSLCRRIGVISYGIYLLHEEIGTILMKKYSSYLGNWSGLAPYLMLLLMIVIAELGYRCVEQKINHFTRRRSSSLVRKAEIA